jgi:purine-nucleoside phosphorylase
MYDSWSAAARAATEFILQRWPRRARVGMILGSGLGGLAELIAVECSPGYDEIPCFPRPTAEGHGGQLICGELDGVPIVAMNGRCHLYEGYSPQSLMLPVCVMHALGIELLIVTNASGGLNPQYRAGDLMVIRDHFSFQPALAVADCPQVMDRQCRVSNAAFVPRLARVAIELGHQAGAPIHQGVYLAVLGPNYETRAEYRMFRRLGADAVGMSTACEVLAAAHLGLPTLGLSAIANVACPDAPTKLTHTQVLAAVASAGHYVRRLLCDFLHHEFGRGSPRPDHSSPAAEAPPVS